MALPRRSSRAYPGAAWMSQAAVMKLAELWSAKKVAYLTTARRTRGKR